MLHFQPRHALTKHEGKRARTIPSRRMSCPGCDNDEIKLCLKRSDGVYRCAQCETERHA